MPENELETPGGPGADGTKTPAITLSQPRPGRYCHYKGNHYLVLGCARHSETEEELVVYRQDYGDRELWVRPKAMFMEAIERDGKLVHRFQFLAPE